MPFQFVAAGVLGLVVLLALAFHEPVVSRIVALDSDADLLDADDLE